MIAERMLELGIELPPLFPPAGNYLGCVIDRGLVYVGGHGPELGDLDRIERIVKVFGMVNCAPGFNQTPVVMDGCSDLLVEIFGDAGRHTRSAVGMAGLPFDIPVEIELIARIRE